MTIQELRDKNLIVLECMSGSRAYDLATPSSDLDIKGVFILPKEQFYGLQYIPQVNDDKNDVVFYEIGRFIELLKQNNPNILELLYTAKSDIIFKHPVLELLDPEIFISKACKRTFGKYALSQIKKSKGLNKKISNPMSKQRKSILSFCYAYTDNHVSSLDSFLKEKEINQKDCGLAKIPHMPGLFEMYWAKDGPYRGILGSLEAVEIRTSSIPKGQTPYALVYFNKDGFSSHCKKHKEYWEWVSNRNPARHELNISHGKDYDSKNMMHVFRLLKMAIEIGKEGKLNVRRSDKNYLLSIKNGQFSYQELLEMVAEKEKELDEAFESSTLQEEPDYVRIDKLAFELRMSLYQSMCEE